MSRADFYNATCPTHGERPFRRRETCQWWECPEYLRGCTSVIPDEIVTPDGADVIQYDQYEDKR